MRENIKWKIEDRSDRHIGGIKVKIEIEIGIGHEGKRGKPWLPRSPLAHSLRSRMQHRTTTHEARHADRSLWEDSIAWKGQEVTATIDSDGIICRRESPRGSRDGWHAFWLIS